MAETLDVGRSSPSCARPSATTRRSSTSSSTPTSPRRRASSRRSTTRSRRATPPRCVVPAHTLKGNSTTIGAMRAGRDRPLARGARARRGDSDGAGDEAAVARRARPGRARRWTSRAPRGGRLSELAERPLERPSTPTARRPGGSWSSTTAASTARRSRACSAASATRSSRRRTAGWRSTCWATTAPAIDVVLLDLVMPELDGFAVLAAIRGEPGPRADPGDRRLGPRRPRRDRPVRRDGRRRLPARGRSSRRSCGPASRTSLADKRLRDDNARLLATVERQRQELSRFLSPQVAALVSTPEGEQLLAGHRRAVTVRVLRPARVHGVRRDRRSPRSCWTSCASTTPRWAGGSSSTRARSSTTRATGSTSSSTTRCSSPTTSCAPCAWPLAMRDDVAALRGRLGQARLRPRVRGRDRGRVRDRRADRRTRAATTTRRSATR